MKATDESMVEIYLAPNAAMADLIKTALENASIPVIEQIYTYYTPSYWIPFRWQLLLEPPYSRFSTRASYADAARQIVNNTLIAFQHGELALTDKEINQVAPESADEFQRSKALSLVEAIKKEKSAANWLVRIIIFGILIYVLTMIIRDLISYLS